MKYDKFLSDKIKQIYKPSEFTVDIKEFPDRFQIIVYENEILKYDLEERMEIMIYLLHIRDIIRGWTGVSCEIKGLLADANRD